MAIENTINEFTSPLGSPNENSTNISGIPKNMKITSWILFFISIIFSVLLI